MQFVVQGLQTGAGPSLLPLLVGLLPYLLKTHVSLQNIYLCLGLDHTFTMCQTAYYQKDIV